MTSLKKVIRMKPKLFRSENIEHKRQKTGEIFLNKYIFFTFEGNFLKCT